MAGVAGDVFFFFGGGAALGVDDGRVEGRGATGGATGGTAFLVRA